MSTSQLILYGILLAAGIASMHFIGMAAMSLNASMIHDPIIFAVSIMVSWGLASMTLTIQLKKNRMLAPLSRHSINVLSALSFGFSVASMHYIAMQSAYFFPVNGEISLVGVNIDLLEKAVLTGVVVLILSLSISLSFKNKLFELNEKSKVKDIQIIDTVNNMSDPFIFTDENGVVLLINKSFTESFNKITRLIEVNGNISFLLSEFNEQYINDEDDFLSETENEQSLEIIIRTNDGNVWLFKKSQCSSSNFIYTWINITNEVNKQKELLHAKDEAINSLEKLHEAQEELSEAKRLASIGKIVNEVAHELNTPIGIAITSLSCLKEETNALCKSYGDGQLTKSSLNNYFLAFENCENLTNTNLKKAAKLIERFKLISADNSCIELKSINLKTFFASIKNVLINQVNGLNVSIHYEVSGDLWVNCTEYLLLQTIEILFENSIVHGFDKQSEGKVTIFATQEGDKVIIAYKDSGKGICTEIVNNIFEPFTSSKRFEGSTGLGLHIAHNIIHQKLKGKLSLKQSNLSGCLFHIELAVSK
ncbi:MAG: hypothetical protein JKY14_08395 [Paraglaciecola sp.]|nr:hypothetical protein [Paraglaciecola sp.]